MSLAINGSLDAVAFEGVLALLCVRGRINPFHSNTAVDRRKHVAFSTRGELDAPRLVFQTGLPALFHLTHVPQVVDPDMPPGCAHHYFVVLRAEGKHLCEGVRQRAKEILPRCTSGWYQPQHIACLPFNGQPEQLAVVCSESPCLPLPESILERARRQRRRAHNLYIVKKKKRAQRQWKGQHPAQWHHTLSGIEILPTSALVRLSHSLMVLSQLPVIRRPAQRSTGTAYFG